MRKGRGFENKYGLIEFNSELIAVLRSATAE